MRTGERSTSEMILGTIILRNVWEIQIHCRKYETKTRAKVSEAVQRLQTDILISHSCCLKLVRWLQTLVHLRGL